MEPWLLWVGLLGVVLYGVILYRMIQVEQGNYRLTEEEEALRWGKILQELPDAKRAQMKRQIAEELAQSRPTP